MYVSVAAALLHRSYALSTSGSEGRWSLHDQHISSILLYSSGKKTLVSCFSCSLEASVVIVLFSLTGKQFVYSQHNVTISVEIKPCRVACCNVLEL